MEYPDSLTAIAKQLDELFDNERFRIIDVKVGAGSRVPLIRLMVDREDRFVTIDDCAELSIKVNDILEVNNCYPKGYRLEVSSAGMSHKLRERWEFRKHLDRKIRIFYSNHEQPKEMEGILSEIHADHLVLLHGEEQVTVTFEDMEYAKSVIDWHHSRSGKGKKKQNARAKSR
jgi:ribosome maturation factor RimP